MIARKSYNFRAVLGAYVLAGVVVAAAITVSATPNQRARSDMLER